MDRFELEIKRIHLLSIAGGRDVDLGAAIDEADRVVAGAKEKRLHAPPLSENPSTEELATAIWQTPAVMQHITSDHMSRKIQAIKEARQIFAVGLKEAKDGVELVEQWQRDGYDPTPVTQEEELKAIESVMETMRKEAPDGPPASS